MVDELPMMLVGYVLVTNTAPYLFQFIWMEVAIEQQR